MDHPKDVICSSSPQELEFPPSSEDHAGHIVQLALKGHTKLAADHILNLERKGYLERTVGNVVRQLRSIAASGGEDDEGIVLYSRIYDTLANMALNLFGMEKRIVGLSDDEVESALGAITAALVNLEEVERKGIFRFDRSIDRRGWNLCGVGCRQTCFSRLFRKREADAITLENAAKYQAIQQGTQTSRYPPFEEVFRSII